jgi:hypothetical protein
VAVSGETPGRAGLGRASEKECTETELSKVKKEKSVLRKKSGKQQA